MLDTIYSCAELLMTNSCKSIYYLSFEKSRLERILVIFEGKVIDIGGFHCWIEYSEVRSTIINQTFRQDLPWQIGV